MCRRMLLLAACLISSLSTGPVAFGAEPEPGESSAGNREVRNAAKPKTANGNEPDQFVALTYPVADLVTAPPAIVSVAIDGAGGKMGEPYSQFIGFDRLIARIKGTVDPANWDTSGGPASIRANEKTWSLMVRHRKAGHEQIGNLLEHLRQQQDVNVIVEIRCLEFSEELADRLSEQIGIDFDSEREQEEGILTRRAEFRLLKAVQQDPEGQAIFPPKVTLLPHQTLWLSGLGTPADSLVLNATASADRRSVNLTIATRGTKDGRPALLNKTARVRHGETFVLDCGASETPIAKSLVGRKAETRTLLLIKPKVVVAEEEEELLTVPTTVDAND